MHQYLVNIPAVNKFHQETNQRAGYQNRSQLPQNRRDHTVNQNCTDERHRNRNQDLNDTFQPYKRKRTARCLTFSIPVEHKRQTKEQRRNRHQLTDPRDTRPSPGHADRTGLPAIPPCHTESPRRCKFQCLKLIAHPQPLRIHAGRQKGIYKITDHYYQQQRKISEKDCKCTKRRQQLARQHDRYQRSRIAAAEKQQIPDKCNRRLYENRH